MTSSDTGHHATPDKYDRIVWIDLEMTGLDPQVDVVLEVAALITDSDLNIIGEGIDMVVHATPEQLGVMNDYVTQMHTSSGLIEEIQASTVTVEQAEQAVLDLMAQHCSPEHAPLLAGNSIGTDRMFIRAYMPRLEAALHYRMIDVSTIKELTRRWHPRAYQNQPDKGMAHRALADITESIRELDYYRRSVFRTDEGPTTEEAKAAKVAATDNYQAFL